MKRLIALMMCAVSLFSAAQCIENPCQLPENSIMVTHTGELWYHFYEPVAGFQLELRPGYPVVGVVGGDWQAAGLNVSVGSGYVLGISFTGATLPPGCGVLTRLEFDLGFDQWYFDAVQGYVIASPDGVALDITNIFGESCDIVGCTDDMACNYNPSSLFDDGSCLTADCNGDCEGTAEVDACGVCGGDARLAEQVAPMPRLATTTLLRQLTTVLV